MFDFKNKDDRRYKRTHYAIRRAAFDLAQKSGWKKVSITELAETANINRNTFYLHFDTIDDVFEDAETEIAKEYSLVLSNTSIPESFVDEEFFAKFEAFLNENKNTVCILSKIGRGENLILKLQEVWTKVFETAFSPAYKNEKEKHIIIKYLSGSMYTFFSTWVQNPDSFDLRKYFFFETEIITMLMRFSEE